MADERSYTHNIHVTTASPGSNAVLTECHGEDEPPGISQVKNVILLTNLNKQLHNATSVQSFNSSDSFTFTDDSSLTSFGSFSESTQSLSTIAPSSQSPDTTPDLPTFGQNIILPLSPLLSVVNNNLETCEVCKMRSLRLVSKGQSNIAGRLEI